MAILSAKKVMAFVDGVVKEENNKRPYKHWTEEDVKSAIFIAVVQWDQMLRSDFTTGMRD